MPKKDYFGGNLHHSILMRMPEKEEYPFDKELEEQEQESSLEEDDSAIPPSDIVVYNELRSCFELKRMEEKGQLQIQPDYQRGLVWQPKDQARFVDSLIKRIPIPSMCFSFDKYTKKRSVIDGLQRISTIISFLTNDNFKISRLDDIDKRISGKTVAKIKEEEDLLYQEVENWNIPITVIHCNTENVKHMEYLFLIFHRLNSGGAKLTNQEIRNCIFTGRLNSLLKRLAARNEFKTLFHIRDDVTYRFAFEELILRYFAFSDKLDSYNGKLGKFLNNYMQEKEKPPKGKEKITDNEIEIKENLFIRVINFLNKKIYTKSNNLTTSKISKTLIESVLIASAKNIDFLETLSMKNAKKIYTTLKNDDLFSIPNLKEGLAQRQKVQDRINRAIEIFSGQ